MSDELKSKVKAAGIKFAAAEKPKSPCSLEPEWDKDDIGL